MKNSGPVAALIALLWLVAPTATHAAEPTQPTGQDKQDQAKEEKPVPEPKLTTSRHQIRIGGKAIAYEATAGTLLMKNDKDEPIALFGFTAYVRQGQDGRTRPIVFAYNGGPGSSSAWLHMGILGPRRAVLDDLQSNTRGPFKLLDNEFSFLDRADLRSGSHDVRAPGFDPQVRRHDQGVHRREFELNERSTSAAGTPESALDDSIREASAATD
jgi:carboxypeptidase C (cathepsin A)